MDIEEKIKFIIPQMGPFYLTRHQVDRGYRLTNRTDEGLGSAPRVEFNAPTLEIVVDKAYQYFMNNRKSCDPHVNLLMKELNDKLPSFVSSFEETKVGMPIDCGDVIQIDYWQIADDEKSFGDMSVLKRNDIQAAKSKIHDEEYAKLDAWFNEIQGNNERTYPNLVYIIDMAWCGFEMVSGRNLQKGT